MNNFLHYFKIVLPSILILIVGQISSKHGMSISSNENTLLTVPVFLFFLGFGYLCLFVRGVVWINILKKIDLSIAYPITSISIVFVMIISHFLFNESITINKILGSVFIIAGSIIITLTDKKND
jgi:drug/metabolite transporter (DMT)-like permease